MRRTSGREIDLEKIVVVGGGQAGASLVAKLRSEGYEGEIALFCEEPVPPYQRPPLSKDYLKGEMELERLYLKPENFYEEARIELHTGRPVTRIDRDAKVVETDDERVPYDALVMTTGSAPRLLPDAMGGNLGCVHVVRSHADIDAMAPKVVSGNTALVVGGGYVGLEAAAVLSTKGMRVVLVEMSERILQRVAAPETSDYFRALHESHGVEIREGVALETLFGDERVQGGRLSTGEEIAADLVVVGIGIEPRTDLAKAAGLTIDNGIAVDAFGRTSDPNIWAAGDCVSFPWQDERIRLESVQNAIDQSECVARNLLGAQEAYDPCIWFWSDQFDTKLQIAGLNLGYDNLVVRQSSATSVSHWYYHDDKLLAVDAMNDPRAYMVAKRLITSGNCPDPGDVTDLDTDLKELLAR